MSSIPGAHASGSNSSIHGLTKNSQHFWKYAPAQPTFVKHYSANFTNTNSCHLNLLLWVGQGRGLMLVTAYSCPNDDTARVCMIFSTHPPQCIIVLLLYFSHNCIFPLCLCHLYVLYYIPLYLYEWPMQSCKELVLASTFELEFVTQAWNSRPDRT